MSFIVLEIHGGAKYATICIDENGENLVFDCMEDAQKEADNCQEALIIETN